MKAVTVSQDAGGKYFASILFEYEEEITERELESFIMRCQSEYLENSKKRRL